MASQVVTVVPCYRESFDRVLRTVESALEVGRVIVVDDGADDAALGKLPCEVIHRATNGGCSAALNTGIKACGDDDVICRLDVGDVFYAVAKRKQIGVVLSGEAHCSSSAHFDPIAGAVYQVPDDWMRRIYRDSVFTGCTNVYPKSVWREVGGHDESLRWLADWDFSMKAQHTIGWHIHPEPTCEAGMHPGGHSDRGGKARLRDHGIVAERGRALSHPDAYAHLRNARWLRKRGLA